MLAGGNEPRDGLSVTGHDIAVPLPNPAQKKGEPAIGIRSRNGFLHGRLPQCSYITYFNSHTENCKRLSSEGAESGKPNVFGFGFIPPGLCAQIKARFLELARQNKSGAVRRFRAINALSP